MNGKPRTEKIKATRIEYIDVAKFIGIFLVVFAHLRRQERETAWIDAFHRPLFFFLSGRTLKIRPEEGFYGFLKRKIHSYIIPYFVLSLVGILVSVIALLIHNEASSLSLDFFVSQLVSRIEEKRYTSIWFVGCLFTSERFAYFLLWFGRKKFYFALLPMSLFLALAIVYNHYTPGFLIWSRDSAFFGTLYVFLGYTFCTKEFKKVHDFILSDRIISLLNGLIGIGIVILVQEYLLKNYNNAHLSRWAAHFSPYYIVLPLALLGCLSTVRISYGISNPVRGKLGQMTLIILAFQQSIGIPVYQKRAVNWSSAIGENTMWNLPWIGYTLVGTFFIITLSVPIYYFFLYTPLCVALNKKLPYSVSLLRKKDNGTN